MTESPCLLVLNAAEGLLHIIIARREEGGAYTRLCAESWHAPAQGAELLIPALDDALRRLRISPRDIGRIAAVRGPGSFTGLRLVLATASGLARATGALQAGLDYLPLLAASALRAIPAQPLEQFNIENVELLRKGLSASPCHDNSAGKRNWTGDQKAALPRGGGAQDVPSQMGSGGLLPKELAAGFPMAEAARCREPSVAPAACTVKRQSQSGNAIEDAPSQSAPANAAFPRRSWVLTHARRNLVHMQGFQEEPGTTDDQKRGMPENRMRPEAACHIGDRAQGMPGAPLALRPLCDVLVCSPEEAALYLARFEAKQPAASLVLGSGLTRNRENFIQALQAEAGTASPPLLLLPSSFDHPSPEALQGAATDAVYDTADPEPLYIRPADAIDNLEKIAASLGLDPEAARKRFQELTG